MGASCKLQVPQIGPARVTLSQVAEILFGERSSLVFLGCTSRISGTIERTASKSVCFEPRRVRLVGAACRAKY